MNFLQFLLFIFLVLPSKIETPPPTTGTPPSTALTVSPQGPAPKSINDGIPRTEDITKSKSDLRMYRFLTLKNRLQLLLISDPDTDMSAASISVNAGNSTKIIQGDPLTQWGGIDALRLLSILNTR